MENDADVQNNTNNIVNNDQQDNINFDEEIVISNVSSQNKNDIQKEKLTIENTIEKDEKIDSEAKKNFKKLINKNTSNKK